MGFLIDDSDDSFMAIQLVAYAWYIAAYDDDAICVSRSDTTTS